MKHAPKLTHADLFRKHSWMYASRRSDGMTETIRIGNGVECGPGWLPLVDVALTKIGEEVRAMRGERRAAFALTQIKEKYGALCIYYRGGNAAIDAIVGRAEALSEHVCERCGDFGMMRVFGGEWYATLCSACAQRHGFSRRVISERAERAGEHN